MRTPPRDLADREVTAATAAGWGLDPATIRYQPVGFGSHHWILVESSGATWFVTADAIDSPADLDQLDAALRTAATLRDRAGLGFVCAPVPLPDGSLITTTGRYAITLHRRLAEVSATSPVDVAELIADLHRATPTVQRIARPDDGSLPGRDSVQRLIDGAGLDPALGPYAAAFDDLVADHRSALITAFAEYDRTAAEIASDPAAWVVTHGEPKQDNIMITEQGSMLIDWDTARLAPPERDLWLIADHDLYTRLTGTAPDPKRLDFYRLRWDLADLCAFGAWFCGPHHADPDIRIGWDASTAICRRLTAGTPGPPWADPASVSER